MFADVNSSQNEITSYFSVYLAVFERTGYESIKVSSSNRKWLKTALNSFYYFNSQNVYKKSQKDCFCHLLGLILSNNSKLNR